MTLTWLNTGEHRQMLQNSLFHLGGVKLYSWTPWSQGFFQLKRFYDFILWPRVS